MNPEQLELLTSANFWGLFTSLQQGLEQLNQYLHQSNAQLLVTPYLWWSVLLGVTLSAAVGFRIFIPPLVLCVGHLFFGVALPEGLQWLGTYPALGVLVSATLAEVAAFYVPHIDNMLQTVATPAAVVAGTLITSGLMGGQVDPVLQWTLALVAGGGAAGAVQGFTAASRGVITATTFGLANPVVTTIENVAATTLATLPFWVPAVVVIAGSGLLLLVLWGLFAIGHRLIFRKKLFDANIKTG